MEREEHMLTAKNDMAAIQQLLLERQRLMAVIQTSQMANGLTIASVAMPASHSVSLGVWVKAGARDERGDENRHCPFSGTYGL